MTRLLRRALLAVAGALVLIGTLTASAGAHAQLISSDPAPGALLSQPPAAVTLTFGEGVQIPTGALEVFDAAGHAVATGPVVHPPGQPTQVSTSLPKAMHGTYVVSWRVISADTHPVQGAFTFSVGAASAGNAAGALEGHLLATRHASALAGFLAGLVRFLVFAGVLLLVGATVLLAWWPSRLPDRTPAVVVGWAAAAVALLSLLAIAVQGPYDAAKPLSEAFSPQVLHPVLSGRFGISALVRTGAALLAAAAALRASTRARIAALAAAATAMVITLSTSGHAITGRWQPLGFIIDVVHVGSAGAWLGGLALVLAVVWRDRSDDDAGRWELARRFSTVATWSIGVIVASGVLQGWRLLGSWSELTTSTYGHVLLVKVALAGVAFEAGMFSRRLLRRRLGVVTPRAALVGVGGRAPDAVDERPAESEARPPAAVWRPDRFVRWILFEALLGVAVVAATALLVDGTPPFAVSQAEAATSLNQTQSIGHHNLVSVAVYPLVPGPVEVSVQYTDGVTLVDPFQLSAQLRLPARGVGPLSVPLKHLGTGTWVATALEVPLPGRWQLMVGVLTDPVTEVDRTFTFNVR